MNYESKHVPIIVCCVTIMLLILYPVGSRLSDGDIRALITIAIPIIFGMFVVLVYRPKE